jgi:hypothetical protein
VRRLDGIIGWLTFFGAVSAELGTCSEKVLEETMERGSRLSLKEFQNFLRLRPGAEKRYVYIMEAAARLGKASWTDLKRNLEVKEHKAVADKVFTNLLENLLNGKGQQLGIGLDIHWRNKNTYPTAPGTHSCPPRPAFAKILSNPLHCSQGFSDASLSYAQKS